MYFACQVIVGTLVLICHHLTEQQQELLVLYKDSQVKKT
jgi:hypothetical protein